MSIEEHLREPEGKTRENKRDLSSPQPVVRSLVAFANTAGGILIVGVEDDGSVLGLSDAQREEERLSNLIADSIRPELQPDIEVMRLGGADLLVVRVARLPGPFFVAQDGPDAGVFVRVGSTNRRASREAAEALRREAERLSFDERPCFGARAEDVDTDRVGEAFSSIGRDPDEGRLLTMGILTVVGRARVPTNGGLILFGSGEARARLVPDAVVRCARFGGTTRERFIDRLEVEGTVLDGIAEANTFVRRNTRIAARIDGLKRIDIPEYPAVALREALVNAVAHCDYSLRGMQISVAVFDDRMVIQSPGMLPFGMTLEDIKEGVSRVRNPVIARVLRELGLMEQWGTGYERIVADCNNLGHPVPVWEEIGETIRVTFRPHPETIAVAGAGKLTSQLSQVNASGPAGAKLAPSWHQVGTKSALSHEQLRLLEFAREERPIGELMALLEWKDRTKFRTKYMVPLLEAGLLTMTIPDKPKSSKQRYVATAEGLAALDGR